MACRLFGAKPIFEPMLAHYQLDFQLQNSMTMCLLMSPAEFRSFCFGLDVLIRKQLRRSHEMLLGRSQDQSA